MRHIYYRLIDYKQIHPLRFWIILLVVLLLLILSVYIIKKIATKKKSKANAEGENLNPEIDKPKENRYFRFLKKNSLLIGIILGQLIIIIALASSLTTNYYPIKNLRENPSISSSEYLFGIDISHYQGKINWTEMQTSHHPIEYIFIRSSMGKNGTDIHFEDNWKNAKAHNYIRGAYHYYRPNENSTLQFENYKSIVKLNKGDFVPILDIEKESRFGRENLRTGVLNWLQLAEEEYGVKPMIYTGLKFYQHILKGHVDNYPLWIAAYSGKHRVKNERWTFHQFTEKAIVKGISTTVDGNDYNGTLDDLKTMLKK